MLHVTHEAFAGRRRPAARGTPRHRLLAWLVAAAVVGSGACNRSGGGPANQRALAIMCDLAGRTDVDPSTELVVTFGQDMDVTSLTPTSVLLTNAGVSMVAQVAGAARQAELFPAGSLEPLTTYAIVVAVTVRAQDGSSPSGEIRFEFTTRDTNASDPPRLVSSTPAAGSEVVPTDTITLRFDRALAPATAGPSSLLVRPAGGLPLGITHQLSGDLREVVMRTPTPLVGGDHEILITTGLQSSNGVELARQITIPFRVRSGFFVVAVEPSHGSRVGLGLSRLRIEFNGEPRAFSVSLRRGATGFWLLTTPEDRTLNVLTTPLRDEGEYEIEVTGADGGGNQAAPFRSTFVVDAEETGWTTPEEIPLQGLLSFGSINNDNLALATSPNGDVALLWTEGDRSGPQRNVFVSLRQSGAWTQRTSLESATNDAGSPQVAINDSGEVVAAWVESRTPNPVVQARILRAGQWGPQQTLTDMRILSVAHIAPNGDAGVLGRGPTGELLGAASLGGNFSSTSRVPGGSVFQVHPTRPSRWQADDIGRRLVLLTLLGGRFSVGATWFVPGQGWLPVEDILPAAPRSIVHEHVTGDGRASVWVDELRFNQPPGMHVQCFRNGVWLGTSLAAGSIETEAVVISGRTGDAIYLTAQPDNNRTRAHAQLFRLDAATLEAGRFVDDLDVVSTRQLGLFGSPDDNAVAHFVRVRPTGTYTASCRWDAASSSFLPLERTSEQVPVPTEVAHDRDGKATMLTTDGAESWRHGRGFTGERRNPYPGRARVLIRDGRVFEMDVRSETRDGQRYDFLRVNMFRRRE